MCGIIGIYNYKNNNLITSHIQSGLKSLQHRGQDSYGYFLGSEKENKIIREIGLIKNHKIENQYKIGLGHTRYATSYLSKSEDINSYIQPLKGNNKQLGDFYLIHNGNINNLKSLINQFNLPNKYLDGYNDSQILVKIIEFCDNTKINHILKKIINTVDGIFNLIIYQINVNNLFFLKDKFGNRPLCIGNNISGYSCYTTTFN